MANTCFSFTFNAFPYVINNRMTSLLHGELGFQGVKYVAIAIFSRFSNPTRGGFGDNVVRVYWGKWRTCFLGRDPLENDYAEHDWNIVSKGNEKFLAQYILSALQQSKHIQPGSPFKTVKTTRLVRLRIKVAQDPKTDRKAILRSADVRLLRNE
jgi:hypothetical protein